MSVEVTLNVFVIVNENILRTPVQGLQTYFVHVVAAVQVHSLTKLSWLRESLRSFFLSYIV